MQSPRNPTLDALGVAVASGVPALLWGAPGTGKTSAVRSLATTLGWSCEVVIAAIREPSDFAGLPVVLDGRVQFAPPLWASRLAGAERGILFLDEISTAPPAVQAALLRVVLERVVGDLHLPDGVVVIAAANPPELASDGWDLSAPLANRFCHLAWEVDGARVARGFAAGWPVPDRFRLPKTWASEMLRARGLISAFISLRPELTCQPPLDAATAGRAWPSPRTWEMAARLLAAADAGGARDEVRSLLVCGSVGDGAGIELLTWLVEMDLPDPELALASADSFQIPPRGDRAHAALAAIVAAVASVPTKSRRAAAWNIIARAAAVKPDVAVVAAQKLAEFQPDGERVPAGVSALLPILRDADIIG